MKGLIELHYLPSVAYFTVALRSYTLLIERHEHYIKQTYRNRCEINTSQGPARLVVPLTSKHGKVLITDIRIDYSQKWLNNHWRAIQSSYAKAPFFEFYADGLHDTIFRRPAFLYDLNMDLLTKCLDWLKISVTIQETSAYEAVPDGDTLDLRNAIHPKNPVGKAIRFNPKPYTQVFGNKFVPNLSLIDLVFCEGPQARNVLEASAGA